MTEEVDKPAPFRIGLIIDSLFQPRWVRRCLEKIVAANVATFAVVIKLPPSKQSEGPLLYKLYNHLDRRFFEATPDALEPESIDGLVDELPGVLADELEKIRDFKLDVLLSFGPTDANVKLADVAKYGVWFYGF